MTMDDINAVMDVERDAFTAPWKREAFESELRANKFAHYVVFEWGTRIIGYCGVWKVMDEAQITNIAIHSAYRGQKFGEWMLRYVMELLKGMGTRTLSLEVRASNHVAQALYKKLGFEKGGVRKNYYADNYEDAWVMWVEMHGT
ncbi:ribosomal protein S18-alanine N-acetyltransferase [Shouchella shacheensis]|uniref:ribosomal protein S18-alanine N-acetyltransferase n=1 Tax=Shouchella shacheensis TaxID=1649580 RepID=UPI00073FF476|nr:ribosomal protein S18-alanine N-acetyltransferase [Shouchella shacheensis]